MGTHPFGGVGVAACDGGAVSYGWGAGPLGRGRGVVAALPRGGLALWVWGQPQGRYGVSAHTAPWGVAPPGAGVRPCGPGTGVGAPCSVRAPARRWAPFLEKKGGKEPQGEGVSSPLDPSSLVGVALRAVPWFGSRPAAQFLVGGKRAHLPARRAGGVGVALRERRECVFLHVTKSSIAYSLPIQSIAK